MSRRKKSKNIELDEIVSPIKKNPYFAKSNFTLYDGDSLKLINDLPEDSIDLIFADPPYNLSNNGFTVHSGKRVSVNKGDWDKSKGFSTDFDFHFKWIEACKRILKPTGSIWISGTYHSIFQCGTILQMNGYHILNDITWYKPNGSPNLSCRFFAASHETLIWARKDKKSKHTFHYKLMKEGNWHNTDFIKNPDKQMRSVWAINTPRKEEKKYGKHPTQKPLELLQRIILSSSNEGDIILDPFAGSSTTGIAAIANNRKFIGIEKYKKYLKISVDRFNELLL